MSYRSSKTSGHFKQFQQTILNILLQLGQLNEGTLFGWGTPKSLEKHSRGRVKSGVLNGDESR